MLDVIENAAGDIEKAAEAERRVIEELRQMGNEVLHNWACRQQQKKEKEFDSKRGVNRKEKKTSTGTPDLEKSK
jgi:G:T-mismatch repair DNA endonuclease (very short patch repair protein)